VVDGGGQIVSSFMNKGLAARKSRDKDRSLLPIHMYSSGFGNVFRNWLRKLHLEQVAPKFLTHIHTHNLSMPIIFAFKLACMKIDLASSRTCFVTPSSSLTFSSENI